MKKNLFFGLFATMVLLLTTACQKENDLLGNGEATISFEISTPQMATRAFSDGATATQLQYAVYDENGAFIGRFSPNATEFKPVEITGFNGKQTINIQLAAGKTYYVLFWASAPNSPYSVNYETKTLSVDYTKTVCNSDVNDAFYCYKSVIVDAAKSEPVSLTRPFAQLNIGTNDLNKLDGVKADKTRVAVTGIYETLNLATKKLDGNINEVRTFALANRPASETFVNETFKTDGYEYLAMAYLLVGDEKKVVNVELSYGDDNGLQTRTFTNIPVKANHRTNIYGALLTNNIGFDVEIEEGFGGESENIEVWDGKKVTKPAYDSATRTYRVKNGAELAWLAALVNGTLPVVARSEEFAPADNLDGETIVLIQNIDLGGKEWTPIGYNQNRFSGTFDGQGNTISGMTITEYNGQPQAALFGNVALTTTFRNLTISGAKVVMPTNHTGDFYAAGLIGTFYGTVTIDNVTVKESTFVGNNKVAGLIAHDGVSSNLSINNCHILDCNISSANTADGGNVGGMVGLFQGAANGEYIIANSSVKNCTIVGINSSNSGKRANAEFVACVNSKANQTLVIENCVVEGNTFSQTIDGSTPVTYVGPYDNKFVGGQREGNEPVGTVVINGVQYPNTAVSTWDEFAAALAANKTYIVLTDDITYDANYQLQKSVTIDLNGKSMTLPMINIHKNVTIKNGTINGKVYARTNSEIVFNKVTFSGAVSDNLSTEGHLAIQGGCKSLYAKDCLFSPTSVSGSQTKPLSFEGGSTIMKFENCEFKSSPYKKQVYFNSLSATAKLDFTNCNFNNKTPNIMFAAACPLTNLTMSGTTKLSSVTLETNRAKDAVTAEDLAYLRESLIANNSMSSVRLFYAGDPSEYIR